MLRLNPFTSRIFTLPVLFISFTMAGLAQEKTTYQDHVLPILRNRCLKCHNPDKSKADLNLANYGDALKGSGNGAVLEGGDPDASKLFLAITHAEEPSMPPNDRLPDVEIAVIRKWIAGGLLETTGSKAVLSTKPKINLAAGTSALEKPEGPPPMPEDVLALDPYVVTERSSVTTALAVSPWAPLIAIGGQHQVFLYDTDTLELAGIVPFTNGYPADVRFSANGRLLIVGGGRGANLGVSTVWDIVEGRRLMSVGEDFDTVLATDLSPDQRFIAHGGPDRLIKVFSTATGELEHKIKKHTDWVTAVRFSHDGRFLATGDRNGGLHVWETAPGAPICTLGGHEDWITGIEWAGSNILVTASEDRTVRIWDTEEAREIRKWNAHDGGVLSLARTKDGQLITSGRDRKATLWDANGKRTRDFKFPGDVPSRAVPSHDGERVVGTDWNGLTYVWRAEDGKKLGGLSLNPPPVEEQLRLAKADWAQVRERHESAQAKLADVTAKLDGAREELARLEEEAGAREEEWKTAQARHDQLKAGPVENVRGALAEAKRLLSETASRHEAAERALTALGEEMQRARDKAEEAEEDARRAEADAESIRQDPDALEEARAEAETLVKNRREAFEQAQADWDRLADDVYPRAEENLRAASNQLTEAENLTENAERKWAEVRDEEKVAEEKLALSRSRVGQAREALASARNGKLAESIQRLEQSAKEAQANAQGEETSLAAARERVRDAELRLAFSEYFRAWSPLRPLQDQREELESAIAEMEAARDRLESELRAGEALDLEPVRVQKCLALQLAQETLAEVENQLAAFQGLRAASETRWRGEEEQYRQIEQRWKKATNRLEKARAGEGKNQGDEANLETLVAREARLRRRLDTAEDAWAVGRSAREIAEDNLQRLAPRIEQAQAAVTQARTDLETFAQRHREKLESLKDRRDEIVARLNDQRQELEKLTSELAPRKREVAKLKEALRLSRRDDRK